MKPHDHSNILDEVPREHWAYPTDKAKHKSSFKMNIDLPAKPEWNDQRLVNKVMYDTVLFNDKSKIVCEVGTPTVSHTI